MSTTPALPKINSSHIHLALRPLNQISAETRLEQELISDSPESPPLAKPYYDPQVQHQYERKYVQIIRCDHEYCPNLQDLYLDLFHYGAELFFKPQFDLFQQCRAEQDELDSSQEDSAVKCMPLFLDEIVPQLVPITERHLQMRRERYSSDPLQSFYDNFYYRDALWFGENSALNIWRRYMGGSQTVSINDCSRFVKEFNTCMAENSNKYSKCFQQHFHSSICEPGYNCPSLQKPLVQCAFRSEHKDQLENCFKSLPNFLPCAIGDTVEDPDIIRQLQRDGAV